MSYKYECPICFLKTLEFKSCYYNSETSEKVAVFSCSECGWMGETVISADQPREFDRIPDQARKNLSRSHETNGRFAKGKTKSLIQLRQIDRHHKE